MRKHRADRLVGNCVRGVGGVGIPGENLANTSNQASISDLAALFTTNLLVPFIAGDELGLGTQVIEDHIVQAEEGVVAGGGLSPVLPLPHLPAGAPGRGRVCNRSGVRKNWIADPVGACAPATGARPQDHEQASVFLRSRLMAVLLPVLQRRAP